MDLKEYITSHSSEEPELLNELNRDTYLKVLRPRMLSGHLQGRFLSMITHMIKPRQILEIGTFTGYGTIALAEGLPDHGTIHTIEANAELEVRIYDWFEKAGIDQKTKLYIGDALKIIPTIDEKFDLVFLDADKHHYPEYYTLLRKILPANSYILADNTLWGKKVLTTPHHTDRETIGVRNFNDMVKDDQGVEKIILPIRDGVTLIRIK